MLIENEYGTIDITNDVIADIVANHCYGVHGMTNKNKLDGFVQLLKRDSSRKGIKIDVDHKLAIVSILTDLLDAFLDL